RFGRRWIAASDGVFGLAGTQRHALCAPGHRRGAPHHTALRAGANVPRPHRPRAAQRPRLDSVRGPGCPAPVPNELQEVPMVEWSELLLPALGASVLVFIASSVIHMVLQLHKAEYRKLANEDDVRAALRAGAPAPGQYLVPHCADPKEMGSPEFVRKLEEGVNAVVYVRPTGQVKLGQFL